MKPSCDACPLRGREPAIECPAHSHSPHLCGHARSGNPYWHESILRKAGAYTPPSEVGLPFPPFEPYDGRIRVGLVSPCAYLGGAERWMSELFDQCDGGKIRWEGVAIRDIPNVPTIPNVVADWEAHASVRSGESAIRELAARVDLLVAWGIESAALEALIPPELNVVEVSHCAFETPQAHATGSMPRSKVVAVGRSALRGLPIDRRETARIIPNGVNPSRVVPLKSRDQVRAEWGIDLNAQVAGWISRISEEKRPEVFIDALPHLPAGWRGVMVGAGLATDAAQAHAAAICRGGVVFPGPTDDVGSALGAFDVMVITSKSEGFCQAIAEAMLAGIPVISTQVGLLEDHPEFARILPNPPTGQDVARACQADLSDVEGTAARVVAARAFAREHLSSDRFGRAWTEYLVSLAPKSPGVFTKFRNLATAVARQAAQGFPGVSDEVKAARLATCSTCPSHDAPGDRCRRCGCNLSIKAGWGSSSCPDRKWIE
jgi:glycosyltransferase involved in cell wall biosynthesis